MFLSLINQKRYPRFHALLKDIKPWVNSFPNFRKEFIKATNCDSYQFDNVLGFIPGSWPLVRLEIIADGIENDPKKGIYGRISGYHDPFSTNQIALEQYFVIQLQYKKQAAEIERYAFFIGYIIVHEIAHFLRFKNRVGKLYDTEFTKEKYNNPNSAEVEAKYNQ